RAATRGAAGRAAPRHPDARLASRRPPRPAYRRALRPGGAMTDRRMLRIATTGARVLAGVLASAVFVIAVVTAVAIPWPTHTQKPVSVTATPAPTDTVLVCGGPLLALGRNAQNAGALSVAAPERLTTAAPAGQPAPR